MTPATFFRELWSGHRLLMTVVGVLLLGNLLVMGVLQQYLVPRVNSREERLIRVQAEVRGGQTTADSPEQLFARGEQDLALFREKIPPYRDFTGLLGDLQEIAGASGLEIDRIAYKYDQDKALRQLRYSLAFAVTGSYRDVKLFIHAIEQSPRLLSIQQIGLQEVRQADLPQVRLQLNLETYFDRGAQ